MGNVQLKMGFDNRVKPGATTRDEVISALQARGIDVQASTPQFDPITGQLLGVVLTIPDTASDVGRETAGGNSGVASPVIVPPPLFMLDLEGISLSTILLNTLVPYTSGERILMSMADPFTLGIVGQTLGWLSGDGAANTYVDRFVNNNPSLQTHALVWITNHNPTPFVVPAEEILLTYDSAQTQQVLNASPITVVGAPNSPSDVVVWVDENGLAYLHFERKDGAVTTQPVSYDQAVKNGAV